MRHHAGKVAKGLMLSGVMTLLLAVTVMASATEMTVGIGRTTGSSLRLRAEASTASSILTYLDKHVAVAILERHDGWYQVRYNGQTGHLSADYVKELTGEDLKAKGRVVGEGVQVYAEASESSKVLAPIENGATVTVNSLSDGWYAVTCTYGTEGYLRSDWVELTGGFVTASASGTDSSGTASSSEIAASSNVIELARQHLGTRYKYGGAAPGGFDCSGFTMYIFNQIGVSLPHSATSQWQSGKGEKVTSLSNLQTGDLVYFRDPAHANGKACSHTGIYIGNGEFIHSSSSRSGGVIISTLLSGYYNKYFVGGLRI